MELSQKISYGESPSHATIALQQGPEAVYAIKAGLKTAAEKSITNRLTVSSAQKNAFEDGKRKRGGDDVEEEEDSDEEEEAGEPEKKKGKGKAVADDAMEEESDDEAPEPAQPKLSANTVIEAGSGETPNSILFCENLPSEVSNDMLSPLFQQSVLALPYPRLDSDLEIVPDTLDSRRSNFCRFRLERIQRTPSCSTRRSRRLGRRRRRSMGSYLVKVERR